MNQLCKVCGEPAAGFHFGAFTCEGCKSFFGRTYNNISAISGCKNNGDCVINKKNRTACKACRLRKCLLVGMSKSGSRYGRRSNWFKIHCLLQEQQTNNHQQHQNNHHQQHQHHQQQQQQPQQQQQHQSSPSSNQSPISTIFDQYNLTHHQLQAKQTYQDKTNPSIIKTDHLHNISSTGGLLVNPFLPSVQQQLLNHNHNHNHKIKNKHNNNINNNNNDIDINNCNKNSASSKQLLSLDSKLSEENTNSNNSGHLNGDADGNFSSSDSCTSTSAYLEDENCTHRKNDSGETESPKDLKYDSSDQSIKLFPFNGHHHHHPYSQQQQQQQHNYHHRTPFGTTFQHIQIPASLLTGNNLTTDTQDEPIDLSTKSIIPQNNLCIRSISTSPTITASVVPPSIELLSKPAPLDLTLVRSQPMSG